MEKVRRTVVLIRQRGKEYGIYLLELEKSILVYFIVPNSPAASSTDGPLYVGDRLLAVGDTENMGNRKSVEGLHPADVIKLINEHPNQVALRVIFHEAAYKILRQQFGQPLDTDDGVRGDRPLLTHDLPPQPPQQLNAAAKAFRWVAKKFTRPKNFSNTQTATTTGTHQSTYDKPNDPYMRHSSTSPESFPLPEGIYDDGLSVSPTNTNSRNQRRREEGSAAATSSGYLGIRRTFTEDGGPYQYIEAPSPPDPEEIEGPPYFQERDEPSRPEVRGASRAIPVPRTPFPRVPTLHTGSVPASASVASRPPVKTRLTPPQLFPLPEGTTTFGSLASARRQDRNVSTEPKGQSGGLLQSPNPDSSSSKGLATSLQTAAPQLSENTPRQRAASESIGSRAGRRSERQVQSCVSPSWCNGQPEPTGFTLVHVRQSPEAAAEGLTHHENDSNSKCSSESPPQPLTGNTSTSSSEAPHSGEEASPSAPLFVAADNSSGASAGEGLADGAGSGEGVQESIGNAPSTNGTYIYGGGFHIAPHSANSVQNPVYGLPGIGTVAAPQSQRHTFEVGAFSRERAPSPPVSLTPDSLLMENEENIYNE